MAGARTGGTTVGLVTDPGLAADVEAAVAERLPATLNQRLPGHGTWRTRTRCVPLATGEQSGLAEIARGYEPDEHSWDYTVLITDLPRREGTDPVMVETDAGDRVAVLSLPALGALRLRHRAERAVAAAVTYLAEGETTATGRRSHNSELLARLRMLAGMVRANRPWRVFAALSKALAGVFGTAALVMLNSAGWQLGDSLGPGRLALLTVLSTAALTTWLIVDHRLWERPKDSGAKRLARLYNATTAITLGTGVISLYVGLFAVLTAVTAVVYQSSVLQSVLQHPTWADRLQIVWFGASAAMVGGALGSGLEDDSVVREAAYGERQRRRNEDQDEAQDADEESDGG